MEKNTKGIKVFLRDSKAISPAIATLILIVIAAVAAAGIGIIVQNAQSNTQSQVGDQDLSVSGNFTIKGSTTIIPIEQNEIAAFNKKYPAVTISMGGGGSGTGRALVWNRQIDIGASSDIWPDADGQTDNGVGGTGLSYGGRLSSVIQAAGPNAFIYETAIGKGLIVLAGNLVDSAGKKVTTINILPFNTSIGNHSYYTSGTHTLNLTFQDLYDGYANNASGQINSANIGGDPFGSVIQLVTRSDVGGTSENFNQWLTGAPSGQMDGTGSNIKTYAVGAVGNQGIRDYINDHTNSMGYVDVGFSVSNGIAGVNSKPNVLAASMNLTFAAKGTSGKGGDYDVYNFGAAKGTSATGKNIIPVSSNASKSLSRDLYFYSQPGVPTGAVQAFLNFVTSPDGQTIVENSGFFKNS
jgi:ABC-type phosphate transport system substrate-binding protein